MRDEMFAPHPWDDEDEGDESAVPPGDEEESDEEPDDDAVHTLNTHTHICSHIVTPTGWNRGGSPGGPRNGINLHVFFTCNPLPPLPRAPSGLLCIPGPRSALVLRY